MDEMKFRRTHLRRRGGVRGSVLKGEDPSLEAVTDADPMGQWGWLSNVMETARQKRQNVSSRAISGNSVYLTMCASRALKVKDPSVETVTHSTPSWKTILIENWSTEF